MGFADTEQKQRVEVLNARIERKKVILKEAYEERTKIMNTCIKRMRRAAGKA